MTIPLKGGYVTKDRRLDRVPYKDPKSRDYPISSFVRGRQPRSYTWNACIDPLDQGEEGACTGFAVAAELAARPSPVAGVDTALARRLYSRAQDLDPWEGKEPEISGSTVLAAVEAACELGHFSSFRWAFGTDDLILALGYAGPAVLGIEWRTGMYEAPGGILRVEGEVVGGHAILARGVSLKRRAVLLRNSWGPDWGIGGDAWISFEDLDRLLRADGEACVPIVRRKS